MKGKEQIEKMDALSEFYIDFFLAQIQTSVDKITRDTKDDWDGDHINYRPIPTD